MTKPIGDEHLDRLAEIAAQLAARVRDDDPEVIGRWLARELPDPTDWWQLSFVLAAAVPIDKPFAHLTAWVRTAAVEHDEVIQQRRRVLLGDHVEPIGAAA